MSSVQERIAACKSFANKKLFEAGGKDLAEYLGNLVQLAEENNVQLDQSEANIFRYEIYSKLDNSVRNWIGNRFFQSRVLKN